MKKTFSVLLVATFLSYVLYEHQWIPPAENLIVGVPSAQPAPVPPPAPSPVTPPPTPTPPPKVMGTYRDGSYVGIVADAYYGNVQVKAIIQGGKLTDVLILDYPRDRQTSQYINNQAMPMLVSEAIVAQSSNIDAISGASASSPAFRQSLASALAQAKI